jgi:ribonuclease HI
MPPSLPSTLAPKRPKTIQLVLIVHNAVSYIGSEGVGFGLIQRGASSIPGVRFTRDYVIPTQERRSSIKRENITTDTVGAAERARLLALLHALRVAGRTVKANQGNMQLENVTVFSDSESTVSLINRYISKSPQNLEDVKNLNDRRTIKKVVRAFRELEKCGVEVDISLPVLDTPVARRADVMIKTMAKQKGRQSCRDRRKMRLVQEKIAMGARAGTEALGGTL